MLLLACADEINDIYLYSLQPHFEEMELSLLNNKWESYYFNSFSTFDKKLKGYVLAGGVNYSQYVSLSISHHNLHRLFEVLKLEIGDDKLSTSRIPERIMDLRVMLGRLQHLFGSVIKDVKPVLDPN